MSSERPFNPLDKKNLGESVADALLARPQSRLPPTQKFEGAGVYAIYYRGDFPAYSLIAERNRLEAEIPIYVGKAVPKGARKGGLTDASPGAVLHARLTQHAESIIAAVNLAIEDFSCRYLTVDDIWIPLGENLLIDRFAPLWNKVVDGFGNHDPGRGRHQGKLPAWDVLHPGRKWAEHLQPGLSAAAVIASIEKEINRSA